MMRLGFSGLGECYDYGGEYGPGCDVFTPGNTATTGKATSSTNIFDAIMSGVNASTKILSTRYGVPQLNPGQYLQTGPGGTVQYQLAPGQSMGFPGLSTFGNSLGSGSGLIIPLMGVGLVLLLMMGKR